MHLRFGILSVGSDDGGHLIGKVDVKESSRGFVGKNSERIRMYSCEGKFEGKFIANLALFLGDEGKFNAQNCMQMRASY